MTTGLGPGRLNVQADLHLEVDGATATVSGSGATVVITTDEPLKFWQAANSSALPDGVGRISGPRAIGDLADALDVVGLRVEVVGPNGPLVRLGSPGDSRVARLLTGSESVSFGKTRALLPPVVSAARRSAALRVGVGAAALGLAGLAWVRARARTRRTG